MDLEKLNKKINQKINDAQREINQLNDLNLDDLDTLNTSPDTKKEKGNGFAVRFEKSQVWKFPNDDKKYRVLNFQPNRRDKEKSLVTFVDDTSAGKKYIMEYKDAEPLAKAAINLQVHEGTEIHTGLLQEKPVAFEEGDLWENKGTYYHIDSRKTAAGGLDNFKVTAYPTQEDWGKKTSGIPTEGGIRMIEELFEVKKTAGSDRRQNYTMEAKRISTNPPVWVKHKGEWFTKIMDTETKKGKMSEEELKDLKVTGEVVDRADKDKPAEKEEEKEKDKKKPPVINPEHQKFVEQIDKLGKGSLVADKGFEKNPAILINILGIGDKRIFVFSERRGKKTFERRETYSALLKKFVDGKKVYVGEEGSPLPVIDPADAPGTKDGEMQTGRTERGGTIATAIPGNKEGKWASGLKIPATKESTKVEEWAARLKIPDKNLKPGDVLGATNPDGTPISADGTSPEQQRDFARELEASRGVYVSTYNAVLAERKRKQSFFGRIGRWFSGEKMSEQDLPADNPTRIAYEQAKASYDALRVAYGKDLVDKETARLIADKKTPEEIAVELTKFQGTVFTKVIVSEQEKLVQAKVEALPKKKQMLILRFMQWYGSKPRAMRALMSLGIGLGVATLSVLLSGAGIAALTASAAGVGIRVVGGQALAGGLVGAKGLFISKKKIQEEFEGSVAKNKEGRKQALVKESMANGTYSPEWLLEQERKYGDMLATRRKKERLNSYLNAGISIGSSALFGFLAGQYAAEHGAALAGTEQPTSTGTFYTGPAADHATGVTYTPETVQVSSRGFIQTIKDLQNHYTDSNMPPALVGDPTKLATQYGFYHPDATAESGMVLHGSTMSINEHGDLILHDVQTGQNSVISTSGFDGHFIDTNVHHGTGASFHTNQGGIEQLQGEPGSGGQMGDFHGSGIETGNQMGAGAGIDQIQGEPGGATGIGSTNPQVIGNGNTIPQAPTDATIGPPPPPGANTGDIPPPAGGPPAAPAPAVENIPVVPDFTPEELTKHFLDDHFGTMQGSTPIEGSYASSPAWEAVKEAKPEDAFEFHNGIVDTNEYTKAMSVADGLSLTDTQITQINSFTDDVAKLAEKLGGVQPTSGMTMEAYVAYLEKINAAK